MMIEKHDRCAQPSRWSWRRCEPQGVVIHDVVCPDDWRRDDAARLLLDGVRQASGKTLPPPIYHFVIDHHGLGYRLAENAAKANHVGACDPDALARLRGGSPPARPQRARGANGNRHTLGIGLIRSGRRVPTTEMTTTLLRLCRSLIEDHEWSVDRVVGHHELTTRKVDPSNLNLVALRDDLRHGIDSVSGETSDFEFRPVLRRGYEGSHIVGPQRRLRECGLLFGRSEGVFEERTEAAVRNYQRAHWLDPDGVIGPKTWAALTPPDERSN